MQIYNHFDVYALNYQVNGEENEFKMERIRETLPEITPEYAQKNKGHKPRVPTLADIEKQRLLAKMNKKHDPTFFLQQDYYHGQPLMKNYFIKLNKVPLNATTGS